MRKDRKFRRRRDITQPRSKNREFGLKTNPRRRPRTEMEASRWLGARTSAAWSTERMPQIRRLEVCAGSEHFGVDLQGHTDGEVHNGAMSLSQ